MTLPDSILFYLRTQHAPVIAPEVIAPEVIAPEVIAPEVIAHGSSKTNKSGPQARAELSRMVGQGLITVPRYGHVGLPDEDDRSDFQTSHRLNYHA